MRVLLIFCAAFPLVGCATVTKGTTEQVTINSEPAGAQARTSIGGSCPLTPCTIEVSRKSEFSVVFSKEGFKDQEVFVGTKVAGSGGAALAGNVVAGGLIGVGVDVATGASMDHFPNPVFVTLEPIKPNVPEKSQGKAKKPQRATPIT